MIYNRDLSAWEHSEQLDRLYMERARRLCGEMTCAAQLASIISELIEKNEMKGVSLLDACCGSGYYARSFTDRNIDIDYWGMDISEKFIAMAIKEIAPATGIPENHFFVEDINWLDEEYDIITCFNSLMSFMDFRPSVERMCCCSRRAVVFRTALSEKREIRYRVDGHLDENWNHLKAYFNIYSYDEFEDFISSFGFRTTRLTDWRCGDGSEISVGLPHPWRILLGERE